MCTPRHAAAAQNSVLVQLRFAAACRGAQFGVCTVWRIVTGGGQGETLYWPLARRARELATKGELWEPSEPYP